MNDYEEEYRGILRLLEAGLGSVELHGYTHMTPDRCAWLAAPDRYDSVGWYRELGAEATAYSAAAPLSEHPILVGCAEIERTFQRRPVTLICPGEEFTLRALEIALDAGIQIVGSYYLGIRWRERLCWSTHVCAPYLNEADPNWLASGLPVVGYFHDKDLVEHGVGWLREQLQKWDRCGVKRWIDYRTLAECIGATSDGDGTARPNRSQT